MSNYLLCGATPLTQVNKLELGLRVLRKTVERKLGKKEDPSIVKGDSKLDSKLTKFIIIEESIKSILEASRTLLISSRACANQDIITGRFLMDYPELDDNSVRLATVKMSEIYLECGTEINSLGSLSDRVQEELAVFYTKGIGDLHEEILTMEECRTDYRAALSWLRETNVDPDKLSQIEKFRRVQGQVKYRKDRFDQMKVAIQAKIDLLRVSRASLISNTMGPLYQKQFEIAKKLSTLYKNAAEGIGKTRLDDYDFKMLKELRNDYERTSLEEDYDLTQEQSIQDDMLLLDISENNEDPGGQSFLSNLACILAEYELPKASEPIGPINSQEADLMDLLESHSTPQVEQNPC